MKPPSPHSLCLRLLAGTSLATAAVLALLGLAVYFSVRQSLLSEFDSALKVKANAFASMTEQGRDGVHFDQELQQMPEFTGGDRPEYFEVWAERGRVLARSPTLGSKDLALPEVTQGLHYWAGRLPDGRPGRFLTLAFVPGSDQEEGPSAPAAPATKAFVVVAKRTHEVDENLEQLRWLLFSLCAAAIAASGAVLLAVVNVAMRPVKRLASEIESLRETDLERRLEPRGVPNELKPVVERLNSLLGRLQSAFGRERAFTADVAHELRTPLSGLQATLDVCRSRSREPSAYEAAIDKCRGIVRQMQAMVHSLLLLARADAGQLPVSLVAVDLSLLVLESWAAFADRAAARGLRIDCDVPEGRAVNSDAEKLRIVLQNLMDNAVSYADPGSSIRIAARVESPSHVVLEVSNSARAVLQNEIPRLFERFWRGDESRTDTGAHCGLGLSLCQRLTTLIGGTIAASTSEGVFTVRLTLPEIATAQGLEIGSPIAAL